MRTPISAEPGKSSSDSLKTGLFFLGPCAVSRAWLAFLGLAFVALPLALLSFASVAQTAPGEVVAPKRASITEFNSSIVKIETKVPKDAQSVATLGAQRIGSGVIIGEGLVLTIGYVLLEADVVNITNGRGGTIPGNVAGYDHATGFGLVKALVPLEGRALSLGDSDRLKVQEKVLTQGHGEGEATELMVASRRTFSGGWEYMIEKPIYTFPAVNNWSGSALISHDGQLMGIGSLIVNDAADAPRGLPGNLFVPVNLLKPILEELLAKGRRRSNIQPWLGMTTELVQDRLLVVRVSKDGPAALAGVEAGDVVMSVGQDAISGQADFYSRVWKLGPAGTAVKLRLANSRGTKDVEIQSIDRFEFMKKPQGI
jgi:serine protease Do